MSRFASISSDLLARKGEARPWLPPAPETPPRPLIEPSFAAPAVQPAPPHSEVQDDELTKRYAVKLTPSEFERLGILAAKLNISRQHILRNAVHDYLSRIEAAYGERCACLTGHACRTDRA